MASPIRLLIVKYSFASCPLLSDTSFRWTHMAKPNMFVVFDSVHFGVSAPGIVLKIMHEAEILELVQLQNLCRAANSAVPDTRNWGSPYVHNQPPIHAVVRSPRLAMTYRSEDGSIRRFQLRFDGNADFETALEIVRSLRCPITSSIGRPSTAQESTYLATPGSQVGERPGTAGSGGAFALPALPVPRRVDPTRLTEGSSPLNVGRNIASSEFYNRNYLRAASLHTQRPPSSPSCDQLQQPSLSSSVQENDRYVNQFDKNSPLPGIMPHQPPSASDSPTRAPTAPVSSLPESLSQCLPPRRDLPFAMRNCSSKGRETSDETDSRPPSPLGNSNSNSKKQNKRKRNIDESQVAPDRTISETGISWNLSRPDVQVASSRRQENTQPARGQDENELAKELHTYSIRPTSERQALIDDMLCRYINNNEFITLCEDIENSWRRIGFDLRR